MLKNAALAFGAVFILIGILGFIPAVTPEGRLLGIFAVDALHNIVHLLSGVVALGVAFTSEEASRLYFKIFGVIYAAVALLGLFYGDRALLGIMAHNWPGFWLHLVSAAVALYLGFATDTTDAAHRRTSAVDRASD